MARLVNFSSPAGTQNANTRLRTGSIYSYLYGVYKIDVTKCTKNVNESREPNQNYDAVFLPCMGYYYNTTYKYLVISFSVLGYLNLCTESYGSVNPISVLKYFYGCEDEDIEEMSLQEYYTWLKEISIQNAQNKGV